jgi:hypothetical protein
MNREQGSNTATELRGPAMPSPFLRSWGISVLVFLTAVIPRAIYPVSRSMLWYYRSISFFEALLSGDWRATYQSYHPGATTTWLAGIGIRLFALLKDQSSAQLLRLEPTQPGMVDAAVKAGVIPLAIVISLCIALSFLLLRRLFGKTTALVGSLLLALDPFHITHSKVLHVDGLLATLMTVSALYILNHAQSGRPRDLIWSGVFAGLALLTKSPALFLLPFTGLTLISGSLTDLGAGAPGAGLRVALKSLSGAMGRLLIWCGLVILVFFIIWPAMWSDPVLMLDRMVERVSFHVSTSHYNPVFFDGRIRFSDPGLGFYLATIAWKTTLVTLPLCGVSVVLAMVSMRGERSSRIALLLVAFVLFFTLQMGLSERKELRYLLPVFPVLDVLAACGLVRLLEFTGRVRIFQEVRWLPTALIILVVGIQTAAVLPHHPYYGTHHNRLLGGTESARDVIPLQDQGEGLDLAAQFLNSLPRVQHSRALIHPLGAELFERIFEGYTTSFEDPWINYRVYYVNQIMRRLDSADWEDTWNSYQSTEPLWTAEFDGVSYVWIYGSPPEDPTEGGPEYEVEYRLGEHIRLTKVRLSALTVASGESLVVAPTWQATEEIQSEYAVFCHLRAPNGEAVAQRDGPPLYGVRPTPGWRVGEVIEDSYEVFIGEEVQPGEYELSIGMYDPDTMDRLPVYNTEGEMVPDGRIVIVPITVE